MIVGTDLGSQAGSNSLESSVAGGGVTGLGGIFNVEASLNRSLISSANSSRCFSRCFGSVPSFKFSRVSLHCLSQQLVQ